MEISLLSGSHSWTRKEWQAVQRQSGETTDPEWTGISRRVPTLTLATVGDIASGTPIMLKYFV